MNLKIDDRICAKNPFSVAEFEKEIVENTIAYEKQLVQKKLDAIASRYQEDNLEIDGIVYFRKIVPTTVSIGRVSVTWHRPIYQGSRNGKKIRHYPADLDLNLPRKTTTSYQVLTNCALLAAFLPFNVCKKVISLLMGVGISEASVKRYSESVGQFAKENLEEIIENRQDMINLSEDEILIASIDGSSSLINGSSAKSNKKRKKKQTRSSIRMTI